METNVCVVPGCSNRYCKRPSLTTVSLYSFPAKDLERKKKWIKFVQQTKEISYSVTEKIGHRICQDHFEKNCFSNWRQFNFGLARRLILKNSAVPTIYPITCNNINKVSPVCNEDEMEPVIQQIEQEAPPESPSLMDSHMHMSMHSPTHSEKLLKTVADIFTQSKYSDTTIACEGQMFPAHKMVLSAASDYFNEIFDYLPDKASVVVLKDISSDTFSDLLKFIYFGEVQIEQSKMDDFISVANSLKVFGIPGDNLYPKDASNVFDGEECGTNQNMPSDGSTLMSVPATKAYIDDVGKNVNRQRKQCGTKRKVMSSGSTQQRVLSKKLCYASDDVHAPGASKNNDRQIQKLVCKTEFPQVTPQDCETRQNSRASEAQSTDRPSLISKSNKDNESSINVVEECWIKEEIDFEDCEEISCSSIKISPTEEGEVSESLASATVDGEETTNLMIQPKKNENQFSNAGIDENIAKKRVVLLGKKIILSKISSKQPSTDPVSCSTGNKEVSNFPSSSSTANGSEFEIIDKISKTTMENLTKAHPCPAKKITCPICPSKLVDPRQYKRHLECHTLSQMFSCRYCDYCSFTYEDAKMHAETHRISVIASPSS